MARVLADPEQLERFSQTLQAFSHNLEQQMQRLNGNLQDVSQHWQDRQQQEFKKDFDETMRSLRAFLQRSKEQHVPYLRKKAATLKRYQNER